jgi:phosphonate metabolism-associated iron-containing alcohol dehydrogenase
VADTPDAWMHFNPVRVVAGRGALNRLPQLVSPGGPVLLVTTEGFARRGVTARVRALFGPGQPVIVHDRVTPNPELDDLESATAALRGRGIESIVAIGGGSVLDTAKGLALSLPSDVDRPFESVFRGGAPQDWRANLKLIAVPSTSGTGSEVTPFATVWDGVEHRKHSLTGERLYPHTALLDPELTLTLPPEETLHTALDSISHSLESLWNKHRTPVSELHAFRALELATDALPRVLEMPGDLDSRALMQQVSLLAGLAISQTRTALAHSVSYPLTSRYAVPHGLACSFTLPAILRANIDELAADQRGATTLRAVLKLLEGLDLGARLNRYLKPAELLALQAEMAAKGRIENFRGRLRGELADLLRESISG